MYMTQSQRDLEQRLRQQQAAGQVDTQAVNSWQSMTGQSVQFPTQTQTATSWNGNTATTSQALANIFEIGKTDRETANKLYQSFKYLQSDPTSSYYNPYTKATNSALDTLAKYGFDVSNVDDNWFAQNKWLEQYYDLRGQTNAPSAPTKKSSAQQIAAYAYYQAGLAYETTKKAKQESEALKNELSYLANWTDKNYSDDDIIGMIDWSKYKTLQAMNDSISQPGGKLLELNSAVDMATDDWMRGVIWAARNDGGTGNVWTDMAMNASGQGNRWQENPDIAARMNKNDNSTYSAYSVGMTLRDEGLYFNEYSFDQEKIDKIRQNLDWNNPTEVKYFQNIVKAEENTQKLEQQLQMMHEDINTLLTYYDNPDDIINAIKDTSEYNGLFNLDKTLYSSDLVGTTRAINYKWEDIEREIRDRCTKKEEEKKTYSDIATDVTAPLTEPIVNTPAQTTPSTQPIQTTPPTVTQPTVTEPVKEPSAAVKAPLEALVKDIENQAQTTARNNLAPYGGAIMANGTDVDKMLWKNGTVIGFDEAAQAIQNAQPMAQNRIKVVTEDLERSAAENYLPSVRTIREYEDVQRTLTKYEDELHNVDLQITSLEAQSRATGGLNEWDAEWVNSLISSDGWQEAKQQIQSDNEWEQFRGYNYVYNFSSGQGNRRFDGSFLDVRGDTIDEILKNVPDLKKLTDAAVNEDYDNASSLNRLTVAEEERLQSLYETKDLLNEMIADTQATLRDGRKAYDDAVTARNKVINDYESAILTYGDISNDLLSKMDLWDQFTSQYTPYTFSSSTYYDDALARGDDPALVMKDAGRSVVSLKNMIDAMQEIRDNVERLGVQATPEDLRNADQAISVLQKEYNEAVRHVLMNSEGFDKEAEKGRNLSTKGMSYVTQMNVDALNGKFSPDYVGVFNRQFLEGANIDSALSNSQDYVKQIFSNMTDKEKDLYFYYLSSSGEKAANDYLKDIVNPINGMVSHRVQEASGEKIKSDIDTTAKSGLAVLESFGTNVLGNIQSFLTMARYNAEDVENYDPNGVGFSWANTTQALREGVKDYIVNEVGEKNAEVFNFFLNALESAGDSTINMLLTSGALAGLGKAVPAVQKLMDFAGKATSGEFGKIVELGTKAASDLLHAMPMAISAANNAYREAIANHASPEQAQAMYNATLWAESLSEAITVGNISEMWNAGETGAVKSLFAALFKNGMEEAVGEGINQFWEDSAEKVIMGEMSSYNQTIESLVASGIPRSEAIKIADQQMVTNIAVAAASGFVSSLGSSTAAYVTGSAKGGAVNDMLSEMAKNDYAKLSAAGDKGAAVTISAVLRNDGQENKVRQTQAGLNKGRNDAMKKGFMADAASMWFVEMSGNNTNAIDTIRGLLAAAKEGIIGVKDAITYGSLTNGESHNVLQRIIDGVSKGDPITQEDVTELLEATNRDKTGPDAKTNALELDNSVTDYRVAARKQQIISQGGAVDVTNASKNVQEKRQVAEAKNKAKEDADAKVEAVASNLASVTEEQAQNPTKDKNGPVQQSANELEGAITDQQRAEEEQQQANQKLEEAKEELDKANETAMAEVTQQAQEEVAQEMQQEQLDDEAVEQEEFEEALQTYKPTKAYERPITVKNVNGNEVKLTGVFAVSPNGDIIYTTTDGYISDSNLDFGEGLSTEDLAVHDKVMNGWEKKNNPIKPAWWLGRSVKATLESDPNTSVDIIGLAGQQADGTEPVLMDVNGNIYSINDLGIDYDVVDDVYDALDNAKDLPVYSDEDMFKLRHPESQIPEKFGLFPDGPTLVQIADTGMPAKVVGAATGENGAVKYVLQDGSVVDTSDVMYPPSEFVDWANENFGGSDITAASESEVQNTDLPTYTTVNGPNGPIENVLSSPAADGVVGLYTDNNGGVWYVMDDGTLAEMLPDNVTDPDLLRWLATKAPALLDNPAQGTPAMTDSVEEVRLDALDKMSTLGIPLISQEDIDNAVAEHMDDLMAQNQTTQGHVNPETNEPLKDWQDPQYHGKVHQPKAKWNPKSKNFLKFLGVDQVPGEARRFVVDSEGNPIVYYRAYGPAFGDNVLYTHHLGPTQAPHGATTPDGKELHANFYGSNKDVVATYAAHNTSDVDITKLRYIKNWETAKKAMQDLGYDLIEAPDPNGSGQWGYQVVDQNGNPAIGFHPKDSKTWFAENQIGRFRTTYGGGLKHMGMHAGFISMRAPLILDANNNSYSKVFGEATAPDGAHIVSDSNNWMSTDRWAAWAFQHGYDTVIVENVKDNAAGGGTPMTDIITSDSGQFKSIWNNGEWNRNNPDTLAKSVDTTASQMAPQTPTEKQAKKVKTKLKSPQQIAKNLIRGLGFGEYLGSNNFGNLPSSIRAYWEKHGESVAVKDQNIGNYSDTMHETGHGIAQKLGIKGTQQMVDNLIAEEPAFEDNYNVSQLKDEAFAEFFWRYMESDERARGFAGDAFVEDFENRLRKDPKMWKEVRLARQQLQQYLNASTDEQLQARVRYERDATRKPFMEQVKEFISRNVDTTSVADEVDAYVGQNSGTRGKLRLQSLFANHSQTRAVTNLTDSLTDADGTIIGKGLGARFSDIGFEGTEENIHLLERYALLLHSIDRDREGKPVFWGLSDEAREAELARIANERPDIVMAEKAWQDFRHEFMQAWMVDTGYWTQDFLDMLEEKYPHYVPTYRVRGDMEEGETTGFGKSSKKYTLKEAVGGSEDIYSPMYSFVGMVDQITNMVGTNQIAQLFDQYYQDNAGMGVFGRQIPGEEAAALDPSGDLQSRLTDLLETEIPEDLMQQVLDIAKGHRAIQPSGGKNILNVQRADGTNVKYEIDNPELYKLLTGVQGSTGIKAMRPIGAFTRTMSMLTTGSNPLFALRNAVRDYQTSVNYGSWASTYLTGIPKWISALVDVVRESDVYKEYKALGGGGWTYIQQNNAKSMEQITGEIFGDDKSNVGKTAKWLGKKVWEIVTAERLNEVIEQASRLVEYKYGKHDRNTAQGRKEAFQAAQDVTVDFSRSGNSETAYVMKKLIPFFNASLQGAYRTTRMFTDAESGRLGTRLAKTAINTALTSALAAGLILRSGDDDDKEEFMMLSDGVKANHLILPNPLKGVLGQAPFLRVPLAQDPFTYAIHNLVTNAMVKGSDDEMAINLAATADVILDNLNPIGGTIFQPFVDASHNKTWYGSNIVRNAQQDWADKSVQYNEDTPEIFKSLGRLVNASPEVIEYLATQYTGFLGAMAIPALTIEKDGSLGGFDALLNAVVKKWTSDPMSSNDVTKEFYEKKNALSTITSVAKADRPENLLLRSLTQEQVNAAYEEAAAMTASGGIVYEANKAINEAYKEIDRINANTTLTDEEKYKQTRDVKLEMLELVETANEAMQAYYKKYIQGETLTDRVFGAVQKMFTEGDYAHIKTTVEKMPEAFQSDIDNQDSVYMQRALSVYNGSADGAGKEAALPHPDRSFTSKDRLGNEVEYEIPDDEWDQYTNIYKAEYESYIIRKGARWDAMTDKQKYDLLKAAHSSANKKMKEAYVKTHPQN